MIKPPMINVAVLGSAYTTLNGINLDVGSLTNQAIRYATGA
ncbi:hypothetical protein [Desulfolucanica intricata]|nr:hypothetical protein [Desulfolucanica intricata]